MITFLAIALVFYFLGRFSCSSSRIETQAIAEKIKQALEKKEQFKVFPKKQPTTQEAETIAELEKNAQKETHP